MKTNTCPFCENAQNYRYIVETELMRAIYPKAPACRYHVLLVPKRHISTIDELKDNEVTELHDLLQKFVEVAHKNIPNFIGYNILSNNGGSAVRQHVMHCHMHIFLRTTADKSDPLSTGHSGTPPALSDKDLKNLDNLRRWTQ